MAPPSLEQRHPISHAEALDVAGRFDRRYDNGSGPKVSSQGDFPGSILNLVIISQISDGLVIA
jgi:hypothetical protein